MEISYTLIIMKKTPFNLETLLAVATPISLLIVAMSIYHLSDRIDELTTSSTSPHPPISIEIASDKHISSHNTVDKKHKNTLDNQATPKNSYASLDTQTQAPAEEPPSSPISKPIETTTTMKPVTQAAEHTRVDYEPTGVTHVVEALNNSPDGAMVYSPGFIKIAPGDSITFKPTSYGHNAQTPESVIGEAYRAIPDGADPFSSRMNEELTVTFTVPGVYLYLCNYHYVVGHVGVIQVGEDTSNLDDVREAGEALKAKMFSNASRVDKYLSMVK